jgi:hypothetical protein
MKFGEPLEHLSRESVNVALAAEIVKQDLD